MAKSLDAQADAFAQLLALSPSDPNLAFRKAAELASGLFPHQIGGVAFLLGRRRAILADDMGLGKTRQAIVALKHVAPNGPYLVVCPASVKTGSSSTTTSSRSTSRRSGGSIGQASFSTRRTT